jgi:hypothetical protein
MSWLLRTLGLMAVLGVLAPPAGALHGGAIADCGAAGTFTLRVTANGAGFESPGPNAHLLFVEGGTLSVLRVVRNGVLVWDPAAVGREANALTEVTCSFELANGVDLEVTGVFAGR